MYYTHDTRSSITLKSHPLRIYKKNQRGFTMIEFIIVLLIVGIIAATSNTLLLRGTTAYYSAQDILVGYWQGNIAMQRFTRDIGKIRSNNDISTVTSTNLVFTDINGNSINYLLSSSSLSINGNTLADGIDLANSSFAYFDSTLTTTSTPSLIRYIKIQLKFIKNNTSYTTITTLYPRNLQ
jgi:prepilin-type N-terminal cleavage/methylation domain-containing protein